MASSLENLQGLASEVVESAFKELLEKKHLYQSLNVDSSRLKASFDEFKSTMASATKLPQDLPLIPEYERAQQYSNSEAVLGRSWACKYEEPGQRRSLAVSQDPFDPLMFRMPNIRIMCPSCDEVLPSILKRASDFLDNLPWKPGMSLGSNTQLFVFAFQCQGCLDVPQVFMVRRSGLKITLSGRSPIEQVLIPAYIPKKERQYYSDAIIAYNSGQVLAGIFLLRTFVEQYIRNLFGGSKLQADKLLDQYMTSLPPDFNSRFPSLKDIYSRLSEAMHEAKASEELFTDTLAKVGNHFDAKRVFKV